MVLAEAVVLGDVLSSDPTGRAQLADNLTAGRRDFLGIALAAGAAAATIDAATHRGVAAATRFASAPAAVSNGSLVWIGSSGVATLTAPTASGSALIEIGTLIGADGVTTTPAVLLRPRFVIYRP